jgi:hypothetical protein
MYRLARLHRRDPVPQYTITKHTTQYTGTQKGTKYFHIWWYTVHCKLGRSPRQLEIQRPENRRLAIMKVRPKRDMTLLPEAEFFDEIQTKV